MSKMVLEMADLCQSIPLRCLTTVLTTMSSQGMLLKMVHCLLLQTFDGERCLYAALNNTVRELLLEQGFKRAGIPRLAL